jgi:hypothetical protein
MKCRSLRTRIATVAAGSTLAAIALFAPAGTASAIVRAYPVNNPCIHLVGSPDPCAPPPPERPEPVDPGCLRVDVEPLHCPYLP